MSRCLQVQITTKSRNEEESRLSVQPAISSAFSLLQMAGFSEGCWTRECGESDGEPVFFGENLYWFKLLATAFKVRFDYG